MSLNVRQQINKLIDSLATASNEIIPVPTLDFKVTRNDQRLGERIEFVLHDRKLSIGAGKKQDYGEETTKIHGVNIGIHHSKKKINQ